MKSQSKKPQKQQWNPNFNLKPSFDTKEEFRNYLYNLEYQTIKNSKRIEYLNLACEVDIESSSFYDNDGNKTAIMYCFTIGVNGHSYLGRTYDDLFEILELYKKVFYLSINRRMIIYVHNLGYEFQFFYKHFQWEKIFSLKSRIPITALTTDGFEFRCSFLLSGYSLAKVGEHLQKYKVEKKVGDLDYNLIRHSETPLTKEEIGYVLNDGLVVMAYIQEQIEEHRNSITKIPLTKTGAVRKYCRDACLYSGGGTHKDKFQSFHRYRVTMLATRIKSVNEYKQLKRAFSGGFTHANGLIVGQKIKHVTSFDFTSSYPYVMVSEKYPMFRGILEEIKSKEEFYEKIHKYCCIFDITFYDLESIIFFDHYISLSHCRDMDKYTLDNGRIVDANKLTITITEQDFFIIKKCYKWKKMEVWNFRSYVKGYLPTPFVKSILDLYQKKTQLKGVEGMEKEYLHSKEMVNSCYGMCVTDICRKEIVFNTETNQWEQDVEPDFEKNLLKYNESKQRFLSYAWGIWVTAYARANLWSGILEFKEDYCYSDTDSIKAVNIDKHRKYINDYNQCAIEKLKRAMEFHHLPFEMVSPKDINGNEHTLGLWDDETEKGYKYTYETFKTLGAKRYMVKYASGKESLTISGLNKKVAIKYLQANGDIFDQFKEGMYIPPEHTGKNTHTYIDTERNGMVKDYLGKWGEYHELSCVHMEGADYTLSLARDYVEFLLHITTMEYN